MRYAALIAASLTVAAQPVAPAASTVKLGHSHMGEAFDEGPRQRPEKMTGIGKAHFPITTAKPEVQEWFNQGIALLHSFWFYEAERTFRWTVKLDPDCAMCWWGLSRSTEDAERGKQFIREAAKRKDKVTPRERLYIEAWEQAPGYDFFRSDRDEKFRYALEKLLIQYPDDIEAKALYGLTNLGGPTRLANDRILKEVLAKDPLHPGAHHYRIHNWNYRDADQALDSAAAYGKVTPAIGHALHMPGHIYATVGMYQEAAISLDSATRAEAKYMRERLIFPFNDWNYGHNRNYLNYTLEQLGMERSAIAGGKELLQNPIDPKYDRASWRSTVHQGMWSLARTLVKFERWKELLDPKTIPWDDLTTAKLWKSYCEARAHLGLGDLDKAEKAIKANAEVKLAEGEKYYEVSKKIMQLELTGLLRLARGEVMEGLTALGEAAQKHYEHQLHDNDPPSYPNSVYVVLGRAYLDRKSPLLAAEAFEKGLDLVRNDAFALSGLVEAYHAMGEKAKAERAMARLLAVWADADPNLPAMARAKATGVVAQAKDESPLPQRNYLRTSLEKFGPPHWQPFQAPQLDAKDADGKRVTLNDYRGKNVVLVFFLGQECAHCLEQLDGLNKRSDEFARIATEIVAVSPSEAKPMNGVRVLTDADKSNAKRFKSYDDFEDIELHATMLIDRYGRVHWARLGGDPFTDYEFLLKELKRMNAMDGPSGQ